MRFARFRGGKPAGYCDQCLVDLPEKIRHNQGMFDQPAARDLVQAVQQHLITNLIPTLPPRQRFQTLVAANVLDIIAREMADGTGLMTDQWHQLANLLGRDGNPPADFTTLHHDITQMNTDLCAAIEAGHFDKPAGFHTLLHHCQQTALAQLTINNPKHLHRLATEQSLRNKKPRPNESGPVPKVGFEPTRA